MGKSDVAVRQWLSDKERFADLFNAAVFDGRPVILAQDLDMIESESDIIVTDKTGKEKGMQRFRDIIMRWKKQMEFVILATESQEKVHYAMPVRTMLYDSLTYTEQINQIWKQHQCNEDKLTDEEFLSHFAKEDKLQAVITLIFYYGTKPWDGSIDLYGMMKLGDNETEQNALKRFIPNYHINLIDAERVANTETFCTDLQLVLDMLQYRNQKDKLIQFVKGHKEYFGSLDEETYYAVRAFLNVGKQIGEIIVQNGDKEGIDMCKALEDLYNDGIEKGVEQGLEQGVQALIEICQELGASKEVLKEKVIDKFGLDADKAEAYLAKYWKEA